MTAGPEQAQWLRRAVATVVRLVPPGRVVAYGDIAELLGVSEPTIKRDTRAAKAFLQKELALGN